MKWSLTVLGSLLYLTLVQAEEWTRIYPEAYTPSALPHYGIALKEDVLPDGTDELLIGSRSGLFARQMISPSGTREPFEVIPSRIPFRIESINIIGHRYVLGGPTGQIAIEQTAETSPAPLDSDTEWMLHNLDTSMPVERILIDKRTIIALSGGYLYQSEDEGLSWKRDSQKVQDAALFNNQVYRITMQAQGENRFLLLHRGEETAWRIEVDDPDEMSEMEADMSRTDLHVLRDPKAGEDHPWGVEGCLVVQASIRINTAPGPSYNTFELRLSTQDGYEWKDHGSQTVQRIFSSDTRTTTTRKNPWNPLELADSQLNNPALIEAGIDRTTNKYATNNSRLFVFEEDQWQTILEYHPSGIFMPGIIQWNSLYLQNLNKIEVLHRTGEHFSYRPNGRLDGFTQAQGTFYTLIENEILFTWNFSDWKALSLDLPDGVSIDDIQNANNQLCLTIHDHVNESWSVRMWKGTLGETLPLTDPVYSLAFRQIDNAFFQLTEEQGDDSQEAVGDVLILKLRPNTSAAPFARIQRSTKEAFTRMECPDEQNLIVFGNSPEIVVIDGNKGMRLIDLREVLPDEYPEIDRTAYVNGWTYLIGSETIRTQDFESFERINPPFGESLINLTVFDDKQVGLTEYAVYTRPLEHDYLGSIQHPQGWYHSDWLGWFQVIDEELGDIDHLLLGKCWVKSVNELEYWIHTEALGWIYVRKDWSPWFWRMEDAHWYWLDHDSWPGRAWDKDDQEWEELGNFSL